jgi:hypothetical protein
MPARVVCEKLRDPKVELHTHPYVYYGDPSKGGPKWRTNKRRTIIFAAKFYMPHQRKNCGRVVTILVWIMSAVTIPGGGEIYRPATFLIKSFILFFHFSGSRSV